MDEEKTRAEVAHIEFISYGTSRIFDRRMRSLDWKRKVVTFLGVFVPLISKKLKFRDKTTFLNKNSICLNKINIKKVIFEQSVDNIN